jgi:hypothetical protein
VKPGKLIAGSIAVYGEERFRSLYGEIVPIDRSGSSSPRTARRSRSADARSS